MSRNLIGFSANSGYLLKSVVHFKSVLPRAGKWYDFIPRFRGGEARQSQANRLGIPMTAFTMDGFSSNGVRRVGIH